MSGPPASFYPMPPIIRDSTADATEHILLMSDLHIGARECDTSLIRAELDWAKDMGAKVFIAGDLFDCIFPGDPRFTPSNLKKELATSAAMCNYARDMAVDILRPYVDNIWLVGIGNHEVTTIKYHHTDMIAFTLDALRPMVSHPIYHGGYSGAIQLTFTVRQTNGATGGGAHYNIFYHHGIGGNAPVTKGRIAMNRIDQGIEGWNILWMGHSHQKWTEPLGDTWTFPTRGNALVKRRGCYLMTGSYTHLRREQFTEKGYYQPNWPLERGMRQGGPGGYKATLQLERPFKGGGNSRRAEVASTVLVEF